MFYDRLLGTGDLFFRQFFVKYTQTFQSKYCGFKVRWRGTGWQALLQAFGWSVGSCGLANVPDSEWMGALACTNAVCFCLSYRGFMNYQYGNKLS